MNKLLQARHAETVAKSAATMAKLFVVTNKAQEAKLIACATKLCALTDQAEIVACLAILCDLTEESTYKELARRQESSNQGRATP